MGKALPTEEELKAAAAEMQKKGARNVLVSLGGEGALLLDENGAYHRAAALPVVPVNTVGAGDSTVAGFLAGVDRGYGYALKLAMACGGATAAGEGLATAEDIAALLK
jgi:1-phosphofructokinase